MGRASSKPNKTAWQLAREARGLTRAQAAELTGWVSDARIEKIESEKSLASPEEILALSKAYKKSELCNHYCTHECAIGKRYVPEIKECSLSEIVLAMLAALNSLQKEKDRLIEICSDGVIHDDQIEDFVFINSKLREISATANALSLWLDDTVEEKRINVELLNEIVAGSKDKK